MRARQLIALSLCIGGSLEHPVHAARGTTSPLPGQIIDIVARDFFFQAPDTIDAGLTTLRLRVQQGEHFVMLVRLDSGHTAADFVRSRHDGKPRPSWAHFLGGPGFPRAGQTANATLVLDPGHYLLMCDVIDPAGVHHFEKGMFHALVVRSAARAQRLAALPRPDATVTMRDYAFDFSEPIHAGERVLRVVNRGQVFHEFRLVHVLPGHTGRESLAWKPGDKTPRPDEDVMAIVGLAPGAELRTTVPFVKGEYVVLCVAQLAHGMIRTFRVTEP
jgi:hypothetical protein